MFHAFLLCTQHNLDYLTQNKKHKVIQTHIIPGWNNYVEIIVSALLPFFLPRVVKR